MGEKTRLKRGDGKWDSPYAHFMCRLLHTTRDLQKRPTKETYKTDLHKRPTKETHLGEGQKACLKRGDFLFEFLAYFLACFKVQRIEFV